MGLKPLRLNLNIHNDCHPELNFYTIFAIKLSLFIKYTQLPF